MKIVEVTTFNDGNVLVMFRCVLNWFGDWSTGALYQVGKEFTSKIDLDNSLVSVLCIYSRCILCLLSALKIGLVFFFTQTSSLF